MHFIEDVIVGRLKLPTMSRSVKKLLMLLRTPDVSMTAIASEIEQDPVLSANMLRLTNTAFYSGRRSVASIGEAVTVAGTQSLQTLLLASGVMSVFVDVPGVNLRRFWMGSLVAAAAARKVAKLLGADSEAAYAAGLFVNIGHLILCQSFADRALSNFTGYESWWGVELAEQELRVFGVAHHTVAALWADKMGFPLTIVQALHGYLDQSVFTTSELACAVRIGHQVAASVEQGDTPTAALNKIGLLLAQHAKRQVLLEDKQFADAYHQLECMQELP